MRAGVEGWEKVALRHTPGREAAVAVSLRGRDDKLPLLSELHPKAALVPARDDADRACCQGGVGQRAEGRGAGLLCSPADSSLVREGLLPGVFRGPELLAGLLDDAGGVHGGGAALPGVPSGSG